MGRFVKKKRTGTGKAAFFTVFRVSSFLGKSTLRSPHILYPNILALPKTREIGDASLPP
jgi:hypothetical protein